MSEQISQLVDSALESDLKNKAFDDACACDERARKWRNYHLIGQAMRDEALTSNLDISSRVASALEDEPTVLAPFALKSRTDDARTDVWKPVGLFALAASLALVAVVTLRPDTTSYSATTQSVARTETAADPELDMEKQRFAQEFDEMLAEHGEFTSTTGLNGLLAYAKLVSNPGLDE